MYNICIFFKCAQGKREAFVQRVKEEGVLSAIREENGCVRYDYYFSEKDKNELLLVESWETKQHQQVHLSMPHMDTLRSFKDEYIESSKLIEIDVK